jgi:hypothetical protein
LIKGPANNYETNRRGGKLGKVIIINHRHFEGADNAERHGTARDELVLVDVFVRKFGFNPQDITVFRDSVNFAGEDLENENETEINKPWPKDVEDFADQIVVNKTKLTVDVVRNIFREGIYIPDTLASLLHINDIQGR